MSVGKWMSIEEVVDDFSQDLPTWQREVNLVWLNNLYSLLSEGGIWGSPNLGTIYRKSCGGFVLVDKL